MQPDRIAMHIRKLGPHQAVNLKLWSLGIDGGESQELDSWDLSEYQGDMAADLAQELHDSAQSDTDELGTKRRYNCIGYDDAGTEVRRWTTSHIPDPSRAGDPTVQLDEPSTQGLLAQTMRHTERAMDVMLKGQERSTRDLMRQLDIKDKRIVALEKREMEVMELHRSLSMAAADPLAAERTADRIDRGLNTLIEKFLPAIGKAKGFLPADFKLDGESVGELAKELLDSDEVVPPTRTE